MQPDQVKEFLRQIASELSDETLPQAERFVSIIDNPAPISIRLHPRKAGNDLFNNEERVPWCQAGRYLPERPQFIFEPEFHAGAYYVQEASSMSIDAVLHELFAGNRNIKVLDLCGAPGGKSTLLASFLNSEGILVSNEVIRSRAFILKENMDKWGFANVIVSNNDPRDFKRLPDYFDLIVCDAPCSGSGMFRKDPETASHWSEQAVEHCAMRQSRIIEESWNALKPGGIFIYSTCSYSEAEDEEQIKILK
ncbi:MAG: RsmB/NOP family class I SAM-dependent RNA methyltransferase, partial [Bacteroidetes bacterium]|nr:RsmB/NOP family class I SAM-dependent RNA methyltransferase [Bacteroidota bacterium]